jgi:hypothetical protein
VKKGDALHMSFLRQVPRHDQVRGSAVNQTKAAGAACSLKGDSLRISGYVAPTSDIPTFF